MWKKKEQKQINKSSSKAKRALINHNSLVAPADRGETSSIMGNSVGDQYTEKEGEE